MGKMPHKPGIAVGVALIALAIVGAALTIGRACVPPPEIRRHRQEMRLRKQLEVLVELSKDQVLAKLGEAAVKRQEMVMRAGFGPRPQLPDGEPYDQWRYNVGDWIYVIWFADPDRNEPNRERWRVCGFDVYHKDVVF